MTDMAVSLMCTNEEKLITLMDMEHLSKKMTQRQGAILYATIVTVSNLYFGDFDTHLVCLLPRYLFLKWYVVKEPIYVAAVLPDW